MKAAPQLYSRQQRQETERHIDEQAVGGVKLYGADTLLVAPPLGNSNRSSWRLYMSALVAASTWGGLVLQAAPQR
ncbi:hypothetical protein RRG08_022778 [Elysia crispata]|uniref:Uncharacterized protein n=1 Tax=Elysia crispata TaxID=231223 RepID=A0AAE1A4K3_9GAST|nr:hypothetical protein RRG08_022778 [Elysia crispata]